MAYRQLVAGIESLDLLHILQLSQQSRTELHIANAGIDNLPESIDRCRKVKKIYAGRNRLSSLPQSISNLTHLTVLYLHDNAFTTFPIALCGLTNLEDLDLSYNQLSDIPVDITRLKVLRIFGLNNNVFTTFPIALCGLTNLEELDLSYNKLSDIPVDITTLKVLRIFGLNNNVFTTFPIALCGLTNLEDLFLYNNKLSDIPVDITKLTKLVILSLKYNNITHLPPKMSSMESLTRLNVKGNPLVQPPQVIAKRGLAAIKRYLEALTDTKGIQSSRIQVNFLGETDTGKTSISRTLQLGKSTLTEMADRTRVVEQGIWVYDQDITFNINDFGGHDVYKIGHPIFISKHGLILITFDFSKYDPNNVAHYQLYIGNWIDKVQAQMPGIKMALVGTHADEVDDELRSAKFSVLKKELSGHKRKKQEWFETQMKKTKLKISKIGPKQISMHEAYKNKVDKLQTLKNQVIDIHQHIFLVSSKTEEGLYELKHYLTSFAREHAVILPGMWVEAATDICRKRQDSSENTLNLDSLKLASSKQFNLNFLMTYFLKLWYSKHKIEQTVCDILSFLAHRGDIIWFKTSPLLRRTIFHKQEILANLLKAILNHDKDATVKTLQDSLTMTAPKKHEVIEDLKTRGMVSKEAMFCLWQPFNLSPEEVDAMTELMQKLELCYQVQEDESLPSNTSFHFPWLLTEERQLELDTKWPSKVPPDTTQLTLQVLFSYKCPDGLYEKFSVRQHKHLGLMKTMRMDWKDGVYAELEECRMQLTRGPHPSNPDPVSQVPDWVISIAVRGSHLSDMWRVLTQGHSDLMDIIKEDWPGLSYDKYLVCPHCVSENNEHPTLFPGEILDQTIRTTSKPRRVPCVKTGVSIPADLVYPPSWQEVLHEKQSRLCEKITEPCLKDMLNEFLQERIITQRESEMVRAEPPQHHDQTSTTRVVCPEKTAVFLDILKTRGDEAFDLLKKCLTENGQSELASLLK